MIWLEEPFKSAWANQDPYQKVRQLSEAAPGQNIYRNKEGRRTFRFEEGGRSYFLKYHQGVGWKEIFKNLLQLRLPVLGARNEYEAAKKLQASTVDTLTPVAYGSRGCNPAAINSFLITDDLINTTSLSDYCRQWPVKRPVYKIKMALIATTAKIARNMHNSGINHRDFYLCHFLLQNDAETKINNDQPFSCFLIDLHRCQIRKHVPTRWQVKDLGGLLYSTMDIGLSTRDYFRFVRVYTGKSLRESLESSLWRKVLCSATKLYQKDFGKEPPVIFRAAR